MNKHAIKSGVIVGIISVVINLLIYIVDPTFFASMWLLLIVFIVTVALVAFFGIKHRGEGSGYISFGQAWIYSMQVMIVAGIISTIFRILLFQVIDPELSDIVVETAVANQESMLSRFGTPEDQIEEQMEMVRESVEEGNTPVGMIKGFLFSLIGYAILSLITGAIIKKKEPELE